MDMESIVNTRVKSIELSPIRKFYNLVSGVPGALSLTIGQPDFNTPRNVKQAGIQAIQENKTTYTHNMGYEELRNEIAGFLKRRYNLAYDYKSEIIATIGGSQAIDSVIRTIVEPGDEILIPSPGYVAYEACVKLAGGVPVFVPAYAEDGFKLRADILKKFITPSTKALILSYPSNPTGASMDENELAKISNVAAGSNIAVISDEIYSELTYGRRHVSIASLDGMKERTIVINGFSKTYSMTGWRLGFVAAPESIIKHIVKVHQYNVSCAPSISQAAGIEALRNGDSSIEYMVQEYDVRRKYCYTRILDMGLECFEPEGAFYLFPNIRKYNASSEDFCKDLLYKGGLAVVPGSAFGKYGEGHIRISYAYSMDVLKEGLDRFEKYLYNI